MWLVHQTPPEDTEGGMRPDRPRTLLSTRHFANYTHFVPQTHPDCKRRILEALGEGLEASV